MVYAGNDVDVSFVWGYLFWGPGAGAFDCELYWGERGGELAVGRVDDCGFNGDLYSGCCGGDGGDVSAAAAEVEGEAVEEVDGGEKV